MYPGREENKRGWEWNLMYLHKKNQNNKQTNKHINKRVYDILQGMTQAEVQALKKGEGIHVPMPLL